MDYSEERRIMMRNEGSLCKTELIISSYGSLSKPGLHLFNEGSILRTEASKLQSKS